MKNKNMKKLSALAMAAVLAVGGKGVLTDAASESGVLQIPLTRASSSGMYVSSAARDELCNHSCPI